MMIHHQTHHCSNHLRITRLISTLPGPLHSLFWHCSEWTHHQTHCHFFALHSTQRMGVLPDPPLPTHSLMVAVTHCQVSPSPAHIIFVFIDLQWDISHLPSTSGKVTAVGIMWRGSHWGGGKAIPVGSAKFEESRKGIDVYEAFWRSITTAG